MKCCMLPAMCSARLPAELVTPGTTCQIVVSSGNASISRAIPSSSRVNIRARSLVSGVGMAPSYTRSMPFKALMSWLGVEEEAAPEHTPLRDLLESLDRLEPDRARHLARFAYLLGRVALADRHASDDEVRAMEALVRDQAQLSAEQATMVVGLAKTSNLLFGGTADYDVAREFADSASYDDKLALARCLFTVASSDQ